MVVEIGYRREAAFLQNEYLWFICVYRSLQGRGESPCGFTNAAYAGKPVHRKWFTARNFSLWFVIFQRRGRQR